MNSFLKLPFAIAVIAFAASCGNTETKKVADKVVGKQTCYMAVSDKDTAFLNLNVTEAGQVVGNLLIKYDGKDKNDGTVAGKFSGDTLFVDYTFSIGDTNKTVYKNPLALLKKDNQMVLGVGQIETTMGKSYFVRGKAINFERGKFTFDPTDCKD